MGLILITGPDGSGKSTLLNKLETALKNRIHILRVPTIDLKLYQTNHSLFDAAKFINKLGEEADKNKMYSFKIIALFGAMSIFGQLCKHLYSTQKKTIFCERHPYIDTFVYAKAYLSVMDPKFLDQKTAHSIEKKHSAELALIMQSIKPSITRTSQGVCYDLLYFLKEWFSQNELKTLDQLFDTPPPNQIYFLSAHSQTLADRIGERTTREYHEKEATLAKMEKMYTKVLTDSGIPFKTIRTENWDQVNELTDQLIFDYS